MNSFNYLFVELPEEEPELSEKPWKDGRRKFKKRKGNRRFDSDDWEETQRARAAYIKEWEEEMRYAEELANEGM
jgi:hypothetical protein